jgi:hypothetical protein
VSQGLEQRPSRVTMVDWLSLTGTCADVRSLRLSFGACSSLLQLADVCTVLYYYLFVLRPRKPPIHSSAQPVQRQFASYALVTGSCWEETYRLSLCGVVFDILIERRQIPDLIFDYRSNLISGSCSCRGAFVSLVPRPSIWKQSSTAGRSGTRPQHSRKFLLSHNSCWEEGSGWLMSV